MYQGKSSRPSGGRSSFGGRSSGGRSSGGYQSRPRFGGGNRRGGGRGGAGIDVSKLINKGAPASDKPAPVFVPTHSFADFAIDERLKQNIITKGYVNPSPIQDQIIPYILDGRDVVGIANTGTGKTAAFVLPLIDKVLRDPSQKVLIVTPTRELAIQIQAELNSFTGGFKIVSGCCVGGAPIGKQIAGLRHPTQFVIGTPGRLKDLMERKVLNLSLFKTVVLDEADRMLDMGFIDDMKYMMAAMSKERHTLFFSATLSREIEALIGSFLNDPVRISVKTQDTSKDVHQDVVRVGGKNKIDVLHDLLIQPGFDKVLVFGKTKHGVERLSNTLIERGFKAESIHGDKPHSRRQKALSLFKDDHVQILVATDVAARGLDISDVSHVINFDLPSTYEDYVHRIGRTGRAGKKGKALSFVD